MLFKCNLYRYAVGFQKLKDDGKMGMLREMYKSWPFFRVTMDLIEMVLAKADPKVAEYYEKVLVEPSLHEFGGRVRFHSTLHHVIVVRQSTVQLMTASMLHIKRGKQSADAILGTQA